MKDKGKILRGWHLALFLLFLLSSGLYIVSLSSERLADFLVRTVGRALRRTLGAITGIFPFSLFETILLLSPVILVLVIIGAIKALRKKGGIIRYPVSLLAVISLFGTAFIFTLGLPYKTTRLDERMELDTSDAHVKDNLIEVATFVRDEVNRYAELIEWTDGATEMPYNMRQLSRVLSEGYSALNKTYSFVEGYRGYVKPVIFSTVMSDLGLTGIYTYPTGEANVNVEYPDYYVPFTAAHEMAHARGFSREDEASFIAFLVCLRSGDDYAIYSAYLNLYEYLASEVSRTDRDAYIELARGLSDTARADIIAAYEVYLEHSDSKLGEISDKVNDAYISANGEDGIASYGYVVKLAVAYLAKNN